MTSGSDTVYQRMSGKLRMFIVDAFAEKLFTGNPAAVCIDLPHEGLGDELMQKIAAEMNLPMTAFVNTVNAGDSLTTARVFRLKWFSPASEGHLCGHATLATAFVVFTVLKANALGLNRTCVHVVGRENCLKGNPNEALQFMTRGGELVVRREGDLFAINFPSASTVKQERSQYLDLLEVLFSDIDVVDSVDLCAARGSLIIRLRDTWTRSEFESWDPNIRLLPPVDRPTSGKIRMVIVTTRGRREDGFTNPTGECYDFVSRVFIPSSSWPEDPVTGSAHTILAKYWGDILGRTRLYARQCSRRSGDLWLEVRSDRIEVKGRAVLVIESQLNVGEISGQKQ